MTEDRRRSPVARTRVLRWVLAALVVAAAVVALATGAAQVCADAVVGEDVRRTCRPPAAGDAAVLAVGGLVALLLVPDLREVSVPGLLTLKARLTAQEERLGALDARLSAVSAASAVVNVHGVGTGRVALDPRRAAREGEALDRARVVAAELLVARLADIGGGEAGGGELAEANLRLYLPTDDGRALRPVLEEPGARVHADEWPSGTGAVGLAWSTGDVVVARGEEVVALLGPLAEQRAERYRDLAVVVALPVLDAGGRPAAVLSASSRDPASRLDGEDALSELLAAGEVVARVLVDLLGWASDPP